MFGYCEHVEFIVEDGNIKEDQILHQITNAYHKNKIVKITDLLVSTVARNSGNCNLIGRVGFDWMHMATYR